MRLIFSTAMLVLSLVGLGFAVYFKEWTAFFISIPFTLQFAYIVYDAYQDYVQLREEVEHLKQQNVKLRKLLSNRGDRK
ncbi:hypothetical protein C6Y40_11315 [Alteromonas alba]|uniref:Uncharacterized protein n=1 Tax=Alteromonas alba TaxID=2079529 RepID=A0A2S9VAM3_9ALTE|nr:hypothetical protein C6Y40_11315 [Alteromonas alba]|tara:strand:- start:448 stop:684 length:237 start_codon:yes stop_codon:yes gene_type:complete